MSDEQVWQFRANALLALVKLANIKIAYDPQWNRFEVEADGFTAQSSHERTIVSEAARVMQEMQ